MGAYTPFLPKEPNERAGRQFPILVFECSPGSVLSSFLFLSQWMLFGETFRNQLLGHRCADDILLSTDDNAELERQVQVRCDVRAELNVKKYECFTRAFFRARRIGWVEDELFNTP